MNFEVWTDVLIQFMGSALWSKSISVAKEAGDGLQKREAKYI